MGVVVDVEDDGINGIVDGGRGGGGGQGLWFCSLVCISVPINVYAPFYYCCCGGGVVGVVPDVVVEVLLIIPVIVLLTLDAAGG